MTMLITNWVRDNMLKIAQMRRNIENMPDSPQKTAALEEIDEMMRNPLATVAGTLKKEIEDIIPDDLIPDLGDAGLKFVRGLGGAVVDAGVGMYDSVAHRMSGKSTEIISSLTIATVTILTVVYLFNAAKSGKV